MSNIKALDKLREVVRCGQGHGFSSAKAYYEVLDGCIAEIEREVSERFVELPEGWTAEQAGEVLGYWPKWDDGSPCMFGDEFTCWPIYYHKEEYEDLSRLVIYAPDHVWDKGKDTEKPHEGGYYEWNYTRPGGENAEEWRPTKRKPRTLDDVLKELANEVWEASCTCQTTWSDSGLDGIEERYAEELRDLLGGDGR